MQKHPIYIDSLTNVWHHELSAVNQYNDIDLIDRLDDEDPFDEYEEYVTFSL
jgi:ureidoglycolate hydrolase